MSVLKSLRKCLHTSIPRLWKLSVCPKLDVEYLTSPENLPEIAKNIALRKGVGDVHLAHELHSKCEQNPADNGLKQRFYEELLKIPNKTHPQVLNYGEEAKVLKELGSRRPEDNLLSFQDIGRKLRLVRTDQLGNFAGSKSYYLLGELAELEAALIRYVVGIVLRNGFELVSVPDILPRGLVEGCGMSTRGSRTQVYSLDANRHGADLCLSGTSEIALAGFLAGQKLRNVPLKLAAVSRCYRAETSNLHEERGLYRVHEFTKVEMFVAAAPSQSERVLEEIRGIQEEIFGGLGLYLRVLDMPSRELGAQAYRKYDIEAWLEGRKYWGEVSSCSNCLDYQARRLGIECEGGFAHTLNGTACAIPRLLIAIVERGQGTGTVAIPEVLRQYMGGKEKIRKQKKIPELKLVKQKG